MGIPAVKPSGQSGVVSDDLDQTAALVPPDSQPSMLQTLPIFISHTGPIYQALMFIDEVEKEEAAIKKGAEKIRDLAKATEYYLKYDPYKKFYLLIIPILSENNKTTDYFVHHLKYEKGKGVIADGDANAHVTRYSDLFFDMLKTLLQREAGVTSPITILTLECSGECSGGEFVEGIFYPHEDPASQKYYSVEIQYNKDDSFSLNVKPVEFADTEYSKSIVFVNEAESFFRDNLVEVISALKPFITEGTFGVLEEGAKEAAKSFQVHIVSDEELSKEGASAKTVGDKYVEVFSGITKSALMPKMLHELVHVLTFKTYHSASVTEAEWHDKVALLLEQAGDPNKTAESPIYTSSVGALYEGLTEFTTRIIIAKHTPKLDFERCPCQYFPTEVLYVLYKLDVITVEDIIWALVSDRTKELYHKIGLRP